MILFLQKKNVVSLKLIYYIIQFAPLIHFLNFLKHLCPFLNYKNIYCPNLMRKCFIQIDFSKEIPWRNICTSINVWSSCVLMFCTDFMYTLLLTVVPSYLSYVLGFDVHLSGIYAALPHVFCTVFRNVK